MQPQIAFQCRALKLPLPRAETGRNGKRNGYRGRSESEIANCSQGGFLAPDREDVEHRACNKERDRKMNDNRMLGVAREERGLHIERVRGRRKQQVHNTLKTDRSAAL